VLDTDKGPGHNIMMTYPGRFTKGRPNDGNSNIIDCRWWF